MFIFFKKYIIIICKKHNDKNSMKTIKQAMLLSVLLTPQTSSAFDVSPLIKKGNYNKPLKMQSDDDLLNDLFTKKNHSNISDKTIHKEVDYYLRLEKKQHSLILGVQENMLKSLKRKITQINIFKNLDLFDALKAKIEPADMPLSENDTVVAMPHYPLKEDYKDTIYINENFLYKNIIAEKIIPNTTQKQSSNHQQEVSEILYHTDFDHKFLEKKEFVSYFYGKLEPQEGGILQGKYKNKELYFLFTRTTDDALRLIDISQSKDKLGIL